MFEKWNIGGCSIRDHFGIYCPGCGGTRSVEHLLDFEIIESLYCNPTVIVVIIDFMIMAVTTIIEKRTNSPAKFATVKIIANAIALVIIIGFFLVRNYLLLYHDFDMLGDFS